MDTAAQATEMIDLVSKDGKHIVKNVNFQIVVAGIVTNVVVRIQGSLDGLNWPNTDYLGDDKTMSADGAYSYYYEGKGDIRFIRLYFVSESGGTAATIDTKVKFY